MAPHKLTKTYNAEYGISTFPTDATKLAEMEFCRIRSFRQPVSLRHTTDLIEDLEFNFIVYHPYRSLVHMTGRDSGPLPIRESMIDMDDNTLQMAWCVHL